MVLRDLRGFVIGLGRWQVIGWLKYTVKALNVYKINKGSKARVIMHN